MILIVPRSNLTCFSNDLVRKVDGESFCEIVARSAVSAFSSNAGDYSAEIGLKIVPRIYVTIWHVILG